MAKRFFKILDDINIDDSNKNTRLVEVGIRLIGCKTREQGESVEMGVAAGSVARILNQELFPMIVLVDREEYFKRKEVSNG